jgi:hypothetical protein
MRHKQDERAYNDLADAEHARAAAEYGLTVEASPGPRRRWWSFRSMTTGEVVATWYMGRRILHSRVAGLVAVDTWKAALAEVVRLERLGRAIAGSSNKRPLRLE